MHPSRFAVNCSILFTELPLLERAQAARAAGFDAVEFWWPFPDAVPSDSDVDRFVASVRDAGVQLVGLNFFAGDMPGGDRGTVSWPERSHEFRDNVDVVVDIGRRLGCRAFNALYGNRVAGVDPDTQDNLAVENLALAARAVEGIDGVVLLEAVSGSEAYPLKLAADAIRVLDRVEQDTGATNLRFLLDAYHLSVNGDDVDAVLHNHLARTGHVQIADAPGRGEPGTGSLDIPGFLGRLDDAGYTGWVALEYKPTTARTIDSLGWLTPEQSTTGRAMAHGTGSELA
ncbi:TIM barrel protein [Georgenia yuyongxinii]|uniref:TIM barrel protein n=1 Tax=Georgenia yuyongxinii TaxID=2589797 RepID=A0A5B8C1J1_9MICO|nr:TIM barrel protein [Georgenia yuyongxinii]QDC23361.1 TIM barrel protein [Georgenia yuyongxinii]